MQNKNKILVVDDNTVNTSIMNELLTDDYEVEIAHNGTDAISITSQFNPDLILLDIMMPGMDGYEVCRQIRQNPTLKYTKIIFVSAKAILESRLQGYKVGGNDYVTKPFNNSELLAKVRVYLRLKAAEELDAMKNELTITVTHELRTPLAIMKNIISNISANVYGPIEPKIQQQLDVIDDNINRQAKIISNFMDTSKIDAGKLNLEYSTFNVQEKINDHLKYFKNFTQDKNITITTHMPANNLFIEADENKFIQILTNLVDNSIRYMDKCKGLIDIKVYEQDNSICVEVSDSGPGIESENLDKIFDKFVQVKRKVGPGEHGTGLGLSIVKGLVELHNGKIWAQSNFGDGTTFCFILPKTKAQAHIKM